jgi:hypothetical protein
MSTTIKLSEFLEKLQKNEVLEGNYVLAFSIKEKCAEDLTLYLDKIDATCFYSEDHVVNRSADNVAWDEDMVFKLRG